MKIGSETFRFAFERKWVEEGDHGLGGFRSAEGMEILGDRHGRVAYTDVRITMEGRLPDEDLQRILMARRLVRSVINRVLQVYRVDTSEAYIEPVSNVDLGRVLVQELEEGDGFTESGFETIDGFVGGLQRAREGEPSSFALETLENDRGLPLPWVLLLDAQREAIYGKHREAVIHCQTGVEVAVQIAVRAFYEAQGENEEAIEVKLDAGLKNLMKDHLPLATQEDFWGTEVQDTWDEEAYSVRHRAVHEGRSVSQEEAATAILACRDVVAWIGQSINWLEQAEVHATDESEG